MFCTMLCLISTFLSWFFLIFWMSGFLIVLGFVTCIPFLYPLPKPLWNSHDLSYGFETFWAQTRHIHVYFDVEFMNLSYLDYELWIFEVGCDNLCPCLLHHLSSYLSWFKHQTTTVTTISGLFSSSTINGSSRLEPNQAASS